jgi:hypothetical protein
VSTPWLASLFIEHMHALAALQLAKFIYGTDIRTVYLKRK